jgi:hypothetical protein
VGVGRIVLISGSGARVVGDGFVLVGRRVGVAMGRAVSALLH